jgi:uncharacterized protein (DUF2141 family)
MGDPLTKIEMSSSRKLATLITQVSNLRAMAGAQSKVIADLTNEVEDLRRKQTGWLQIRILAAIYRIPQERVLQAIRSECERIQTEERIALVGRRVRCAKD